MATSFVIDVPCFIRLRIREEQCFCNYVYYLKSRFELFTRHTHVKVSINDLNDFKDRKLKRNEKFIYKNIMFFRFVSHGSFTE